MRNVMMMAIGAVAAVAVAMLFAQRVTRHGDRAAVLQPTAARADDLSRQSIAPAHYALINSLWGETSIAPCMVEAVWGEGASQASFAPQIRLSTRTPLRAAATPALGVSWSSRAKFAPPADAEATPSQVAMEPGVAPVVRVLDIANFRRPAAAAARAARTYGQALRAA